MRVILFDKDGTLLDFEKVWGPYAEECINTFVKDFDKPHEKENLQESLGVADGKVKANSIVASGTGRDIHETFERYAEGGREWAKKHYEDNFDFIFEHMKLLKGAKQTMKVLHDLGYKNVIVTSDSRKGTEAFIKKFGLDDLVMDVVAGDDNNYCKPDIRVLDQLMERYNLNIEDLVMVGDNTSDTLLGLKEGLYTVGVLSGTSTSTADLEGADLILESVEELIENGEFVLDRRS
jgi:phosphoglycolate phosphatase